MLKKICLIISIIAMCQNVYAANLAELANMALERNLQIKIAELEIEQSLIDEKNAHNAMIPNVNFTIGRNFNEYYDRYQRGLNQAENTWTYSLKLTQNYPGLGKVPAIQKQITALKTEIKKVHNENYKLGILRNLTKIYFQLVKDQEMVKIHETDLRLIEELLKVAKLNEEVGLVLHNDVLRIEVEQHNSDSELIKARGDYATQIFDLAAILDIDDPYSIQLDLPKSLKFASEEYSGRDLIKELFSLDYDINLANKDLEILEKVVKQSEKAMLPTLSLNSTYTYGNKYGSDRGGKDNKNLVTTFELVTPVYDSNDLKNAVRTAKKSEEIGKLTLENLQNNKKSSLEKALKNYNDALARIILAEKMVEQSYENMRIVFTRYQEGAASIVELVDAQRLLTNSSQTATSAYYDERTAKAEILLLTHRFDELYKMDINPIMPKRENILTASLNLTGEEE